MKTILNFITGAITGALAVIIAAIGKGTSTEKKLINKKAPSPQPENRSFKDFIEHIKTVKFGIDQKADDLENKAKVKMRSLRADFKTVFGNSP